MSCLPLLATTAASYAITVLLLKRLILAEKIARRGHHLAREYSADPFELLRASDVVVTAAGHRHKSYPLVDRDRRVIGMVGRTDVLRWSGAGDHAGLTLYDAGFRPIGRRGASRHRARALGRSDDRA